MDTVEDDHPQGATPPARGRRGLAQIVLPLLIALIASALLAGPTLAHHKPGHQTPPGHGPKDPGKGPKKPPKDGGVHDNRGTVKIHLGATEPEAVMRSQPQVCTFHVHMFKFHADQTLDISIVGHGGPNAGPSTYSNTATTDADGEARIPAAGAIQLADGNYKLTVLTGHGNGGKHKVLKVDCTDEDANPPIPPGDDQGNLPIPPGDDRGNPPNPGSGDNQGNQPNPGDEDISPPAGPVPGQDPETGPDDVPVAPPKPGDLPDTAVDSSSVEPARVGMAMSVLLLAALGGFAFVVRRRLSQG